MDPCCRKLGNLREDLPIAISSSLEAIAFTSSYQSVSNNCRSFKICHFKFVVSYLAMNASEAEVDLGRFLFDQNAGFGSEWNRHFPEFHSEILGVPREVGLKLRKIGITGKFRSSRPFLLGPSFSEPGNRNSTWLILKLLNIILVLYETND